MSKNRTRVSALSVFMLLAFSHIAFADTVQGRVAATSPSSLDMIVYDAQGHPYPNILHLKADRHTQLKGVGVVSLLKKQDAISVDVRQQNDGVWRADSITKLQTAQTVQSAQNPSSPSLMDALKSPTGQKIIRNGLTGAITGAVASGASGGKAGKGALIGAGAGIAGGLLMDLFGQHQQSQSSSPSVSSQEDAKR